MKERNDRKKERQREERDVGRIMDTEGKTKGHRKKGRQEKRK